MICNIHNTVGFQTQDSFLLLNSGSFLCNSFDRLEDWKHVRFGFTYSLTRSSSTENISGSINYSIPQYSWESRPFIGITNTSNSIYPFYQNSSGIGYTGIGQTGSLAVVSTPTLIKVQSTYSGSDSSSISVISNGMFLSSSICSLGSSSLIHQLRNSNNYPNTNPYNLFIIDFKYTASFGYNVSFSQTSSNSPTLEHLSSSVENYSSMFNSSFSMDRILNLNTIVIKGTEYEPFFRIHAFYLVRYK